MKRKYFGICVLLVSILLTSAAVYDGYAGDVERKVTRGGANFGKMLKNGVTAAGDFSGSLRGQIRVGNHQFVITKDTRIYKTGKGLIDRGKHFSNAAIYVSGIQKKNVNYARIVIVTDKKSGSGNGSGAGELKRDEAQ